MNAADALNLTSGTDPAFDTLARALADHPPKLVSGMLTTADGDTLPGAPGRRGRQPVSEHFPEEVFPDVPHEQISGALSELADRFPRESDKGFADFFVDTHRGKFIFCERRGGWFVYRDGIFQPGHTHREIFSAINHTVEVLRAIAWSLPPGAFRRDDRLRWVTRLEQRTQRLGILSEISKRPEIAVDYTELDAIEDPSVMLTPAQKARHEEAIYQIATPDGMLDFKRREILPHSPDFLVTKCTAVGWDPKSAPHTDERLEWMVEFMFGHLQPKTVEHLFTLLGSALFGENYFKRVLLLTGKGDTLKTTFSNLIRRTLGLYACNLDPRAIMAGGRNSAGHTDYLMPIVGSRLAVIEEFPDGKSLDAGELKVMSGGGAKHVSAKGLKGFEVVPMTLILLNSNHEPRMDGTDLAAWGRVDHVALVNVIPPDKKQENARTAIARDPSMQRAMFCKLVQGALRALESGGNLQTPEELLEKREEIREEQNPYADFIAECMELGEDLTFRMLEAQEALRMWYDEKRIPQSQWKDDARLLAAAFRGHYGLRDTDARDRKLRDGSRLYWTGARVRPEALRRTDSPM